MELNKLKQASDIYQLMSDKTIEQALQTLNTYRDLDDDVRQLVISLIHNAQQSSAYFNEKVAGQFSNKSVKIWQVGDHIGDYELLAPIGQGGMSMVFKAKRINSDTQKPVAIKIFSVGYNSPELRAKFVDEQKILASLSHPNIIAFHHGETTDDGDAYIVMELLHDGLAIDQYCQQHDLNNKSIVTLMIQALKAIQYAHNHLIIHRDIKPSNIIVSKSGQLKVLDFGIAKLLKPAKPDESDDINGDEQPTLVALTPSFASPEQIAGDAIDITSDVFSLAAVLVTLLSGEQPFPADRMLKACQNDYDHVRTLLNKHGVDRDLSNILLQALHPDKTQRYANAFALQEDLQAWLSQKPVTATGDSWWYRLRCFIQRRTALFGLSVVLFLTVISSIIGLSWQNKTIKLEAQKANAVKQFMLDAFSVTDPNVSQGVDLSAKDILKVAAQKIDDRQNIDQKIQFELYQALALAHGRLGFYTEAIDLLNKTLAIDATDQHSFALMAQYLLASGSRDDLQNLLVQTQEDQFDLPEDRAIFKRVRVLNLAQAGDYEQALKHFNLLDKWSQEPLDQVKNQAVLAEVYYLKGESEKSIEIIEAVKKAHPLPETHILNLGLNTDLVEYHDRVGNFSEALSLAKRNIELYDAILGDRHPNLGQAYNALSVFERLDGNLPEALKAAQKSEQIYRERYGDSSEGLSQALSNAGMVHYYLDDKDESLKLFKASADMLIDIFSAEHPEAINAQANLAIILNATGHPEESLALSQKIYAIEVKTLGEYHRSPLMTQRSMALTLASLERYDEAIAMAEENLDSVNKHFNDRQNMIDVTRSVLARVFYMAGQYEEAIPHFIKVLESPAQADENNMAQFTQLVAKSHWQLNNHDKANEYYAKWTEKLAQIYGQTDQKYLAAQLEWAKQLHSINQFEQAQVLTEAVREIVSTHQIDDEDIHKQLKELSAETTPYH